MDYEDWCAAQEGPPSVCPDCGRAFDSTDAGAIEEHRDEEWAAFLRAQCPIPPPELSTWRRPVIEDDEPDVPF